MVRAIPAVVIVALAMAAPAWTGKTAPKPRCTAPAAHLSASGSTVSEVGGRCVVLQKVRNKLRKKAMPAGSLSFLYQYQQYDQAGSSCGALVKENGRSFSLKPVPYQLKVRFGVLTKGLKQAVWGRWQNFSLGGFGLQCGALTASTTLPGPAQLCAWPEVDIPFFMIGKSGSCGVPLPDSCAWSSPATLKGGVVTAGSIACQAPPCEYVTTHPPVRWFTPTPIAVPAGLACSDPADPSSGAAVGVVLIQLGHYDSNNQFVVDCQANPDAISVTSFTVPSWWGGSSPVMRIDSWLVPIHNNRLSRQYEATTSEFNLSGDRSGCPLSLAPING